MKKLSLVVIALFAFALPAAAQAQGGADHKKAAKECKALGKKMGAKGFAGKKAERRIAKCQRKLRKAALRQARRACRAEGRLRGPALKRCVKAKLAGDSAPSTDELENAAQECKAMREGDPEEFIAEFGDGPNAFGKCVVSHVQDEDGDAESAEGDEPDSGEPEDSVDEPADEPGSGAGL